MIPLVSAGVGLLTQWLKGRSDLKKLEQEQKASEVRQRTALIQSQTNHNHAWELAALSADRLSSLRLASFWLYTGLLLLAIVAPDYAATVWFALDRVPDWIIGVQMTMVGYIWAAKPIANLGAGIVQKAKGQQ
ncbi:hypothetical protein [Endozoicomonas sp. ALB091]|uniref:hypothetical protein n=1 Tax=Endozoicomonas sp. ALB091 TaxID=3403073 RepID=UPI003BB71BDB